ncbi:MAG TPA: hypothetical protein IAB92_07515 [Candidatus Faecousia faecigallinarum]|nr:hypothetical protein [Candidatus Faecousia faecigallinarum]
MINNVLEKFGIYDIVAVLLSGICICTFSLAVDQLLFGSRFSSLLSTDNAISFFVISYFIGLLFQEIGSLFYRKFINKKNRILLNALDTSKKSSHQLLTKEEKEAVHQIVRAELCLEEEANIEILYNYCKFYLISTGNTAKIDKDQSIAAMSRSLSIYFLFLFFYILFVAISEKSTIYILWSALSLVLFFVFLSRSKRFCVLRYIYVFRYFLYNFSRNPK